MELFTSPSIKKRYYSPNMSIGSVSRYKRTITEIYNDQSTSASPKGEQKGYRSDLNLRSMLVQIEPLNPSEKQLLKQRNSYQF